MSIFKSTKPTNLGSRTIRGTEVARQTGDLHGHLVSETARRLGIFEVGNGGNGGLVIQSKYGEMVIQSKYGESATRCYL